MQPGCLDSLLRIGMSVISAALIATGVLLLFFGLFSSSSLTGLQTAVSFLAATAAIYVFGRVGREIWRDLQKPQLPEKKQEDSTPSPGENDD